jgi:hypothetical protein
MAKERIGKVAMIERIGAKLTNHRWGWDATMPDGSIVFIGWNYRATRSAAEEVESCEIFKYDSSRDDKPGYRERARHIQQLLESGEAGYLLIATPKDPSAYPHEIERVDDRLWVRLFWNGFMASNLDELDLAGGIRCRVAGSRRLVQDDVLVRGAMGSSVPTDATGSGGLDPASWRT